MQFLPEGVFGLSYDRALNEAGRKFKEVGRQKIGYDEVVMKTASGLWDSRLLIQMGRCPACDSPRVKAVTLRQDGLTLVECGDCGLAYVDPRPSSEQLRNYYDAGYFRGEKSFFEGQDYCQVRDEAVAQRNVTGYAEIISSLDLKGKTVLEVGCGSGALLRLLSEHGPAQLTGIDVAEYPVNYGRAKYQLDLRCGILETEAFPSASFDLVVMVDLIEHVEDLRGFMKEVTRILRPGGNVFLLTPNYRAFRRARLSWICLYKDFEHLQYLSPASLEKLAAQLRFRVMRCWTRGLPVLLATYPRLHRWRLHWLLYPGVGLSNLVRKLKYISLPFGRMDGGHDLCAILKKERTGLEPQLL